MKSKIKELDVLTLNDNKKYLVSCVAELDDIKYLFLVDMEDNTNFKLMAERLVGEEIHLTVVEDKDLMARLMPEFLKGSRKAISQLKNMVEEGEDNDVK